MDARECLTLVDEGDSGFSAIKCLVANPAMRMSFWSDKHLAIVFPSFPQPIKLIVIVMGRYPMVICDQVNIKQVTNQSFDGVPLYTQLC